PAAIVTSGVAGAAVGWFPLAPGEAYWPWYMSDPNYIAAVNTGIVADPRNLAARPGGDPASGSLPFANRRAATIVPAQAFASAQPVGRSALPISDPAAQRARVTAQAPARPAGAAARAAGGGRAAAGAAAGPSAAAAGRGGAQAARAAAAHGAAAPRMAHAGAAHIAAAPR